MVIRLHVKYRRRNSLSIPNGFFPWNAERESLLISEEDYMKLLYLNGYPPMIDSISPNSGFVFEGEYITCAISFPKLKVVYTDRLITHS